MAKKHGPIVDAYRNKNRDRKRRGGDLFHNIGSLLKAVPSGHRKKKKKHSYSPKKSYSASTSKTNTTKKKTAQTQVTEPLTLGDILILGVFIVLFILVFKIGFLKTVLISLALLTVYIIINALIENKTGSSTETDESTQIPHLKSLLEEIRQHQAIVNTSKNPNEVKKHLDCLLRIIDEIATFDESVLKQAGMTKTNYESTRAELLEVYDTMITQAQENNVDDSIIEQPQNQSSIAANDRIIPLETFLAAAVPSNQGLYPHEILMLHYANTYKVDGDNRFQSFWLYKYSVKNPQDILDSLLQRGFISIGDLRSALERQTVTTLKTQLQELGEKTIGKKAELIDRLINSGNIVCLEKHFSERYYMLTDAGFKELSENEYVIYLHRTGRMSVWEMNQRLANNPDNFSYRDFLWQSFNRQAEQHFIDANMGLYRNVRLTMYQFLMEEGRVLPAFGHLCEVIAYDLSSMDNWEEHNPSPELLKLKVVSALKYCFPYTGSQAKLPPMVIKWAAEMQKKLGLDDDEYRAALLEQFEKIYLLRRIFTSEECADIVMYEIGNHPRKLSAIYNQAEERLKKEYERML